MLEGKRFPFIKNTNSLGLSSVLPYLPITLTSRNRSVEAMALLDTGATVNVLPYEIGIQLAAVWEEQCNVTEHGGLLAMKPNFEKMSRKELKAYVLAHRDDADAIRSLFNRRSPDETATWYSTNSHKEIEEILRRKIDGEL